MAKRGQRKRRERASRAPVSQMAQVSAASPWPGHANEERLRWILPPVSGSFDGIDLALLDPADPDDRHFLLMAEHPDYYWAIERDEEEVEEEGSPVNPRLHVTLHEVVASQLWDGNPPEVWPTVGRLRRLGYGRHDILHMLASVVMEHLWQGVQQRTTVNPEQYCPGPRSPAG